MPVSPVSVTKSSVRRSDTADPHNAHRDSLPDYTVFIFITDCRSTLQSLQSREKGQILQDIRQELPSLGSKTTLALQWILCHCGIMIIIIIIIMKNLGAVNRHGGLVVKASAS